MSPTHFREGRLDEHEKLETVEESASAQARTKEASSMRAVVTLAEPAGRDVVMGTTRGILFAADSVTSETRELEPVNSSGQKLANELRYKRPAASNKARRDGSSETGSLERDRQLDLGVVDDPRHKTESIGSSQRIVEPLTLEHGWNDQKQEKIRGVSIQGELRIAVPDGKSPNEANS